MLNVKIERLREPRIFLVLTFVLLAAILLFYFITSMITSVGYQTMSNSDPEILVSKPNKRVTVIIDAGHGGEDPGAIANHIVEKELNLLVAKKVKDFLILSGYDVVLTRSDDRLLYNAGEEDRKKFFDLKNRVKISESYENSIFVSIHMNKYPLDDCRGLQVFFSDQNPQSKILAQNVQDASKLLSPNNLRQIKQDQGTVFLLKNLKSPSVLIECGFLSNPDEAQLLTQTIYQDKLSLTICFGIINFLKECQVIST